LGGAAKKLDDTKLQARYRERLIPEDIDGRDIQRGGHWGEVLLMVSISLKRREGRNKIGFPNHEEKGVPQEIPAQSMPVPGELSSKEKGFWGDLSPLGAKRKTNSGIRFAEHEDTYPR